jgi:hypothetical protein
LLVGKRMFHLQKLRRVVSAPYSRKKCITLLFYLQGGMISIVPRYRATNGMAGMQLVQRTRPRFGRGCVKTKSDFWKRDTGATIEAIMPGCSTCSRHINSKLCLRGNFLSNFENSLFSNSLGQKETFSRKQKRRPAGRPYQVCFWVWAMDRWRFSQFSQSPIEHCNSRQSNSHNWISSGASWITLFLSRCHNP